MDRGVRARDGQTVRERLAEILIELEDGGQRVADVIKCVLDRIPLGKQFREQRRGHGEPALRLGLEDERHLVMCHSAPFPSPGRQHFSRSRKAMLKLWQPRPSSGSLSST